MSREFFYLVAILSVLVLGVVTNYVAYDQDSSIKSLDSVVALSGVRDVALQKAFYQQSQNVAYQEMIGIKKMDFVYEK